MDIKILRGKIVEALEKDIANDELIENFCILMDKIINHKLEDLIDK